MSPNAREAPSPPAASLSVEAMKLQARSFRGTIANQLDQLPCLEHSPSITDGVGSLRCGRDVSERD
jgi:hypothetical protein